MATLDITFTAGSETGASIRRLAGVIEKAAMGLPDRQPTGASTVLRFDNNPSSGTVSVQVQAGPITSAVFIV